MGVLEQLFTLSNVMLCLAIVALVWAQRTCAEVMIAALGRKLGKAWDITKSKVWSEFLVPLGPLGTGGLMMLVPGLPIPEMFSEGTPAKIIFGIGLGLISAHLFRLIKKMIFDKAGKEDEKTDYVKE